MGRIWLVGGFLVLVVAACGDDGSSEGVGTRIGPDGGAVTSVDGLLTLTVPPSALDETVEITVTSGSAADLPELSEEDLVTGVYELAPPGLEFAVPVVLEISAEVGEELPIPLLVVFGDDGEVSVATDQTVSVEAGVATISGAISHFSTATAVGGQLSFSYTPYSIEAVVGETFTFTFFMTGGTGLRNPVVYELEAEGSEPLERVSIERKSGVIGDPATTSESDPETLRRLASSVEFGTAYKCAGEGEGTASVVATLIDEREVFPALTLGEDIFDDGHRVVLKATATCRPADTASGTTLVAAPGGGGSESDPGDSTTTDEPTQTFAPVPVIDMDGSLIPLAQLFAFEQHPATIVVLDVQGEDEIFKDSILTAMGGPYPEHPAEACNNGHFHGIGFNPNLVDIAGNAVLEKYPAGCGAGIAGTEKVVLFSTTVIEKWTQLTGLDVQAVDRDQDGVSYKDDCDDYDPTVGAEDDDCPPDQFLGGG